MSKKPITALMIIEMIGRPKEHLEETFKEYIKKMGSEKDVTLINEKIHEPKKIEYKPDEKKEETNVEAELFLTFAEIEIESKDIITLMRIIFNYLPSHVELISPEYLELKNIDFNELFNEVIRRIHEYDNITKSVLMKNKIMHDQFQQIINNLKKPVIKTEENLPKEVEEKTEESNIKPKKLDKKN